MLLVSIIINNYNYGRYLAPAIESALGQTYPAVEVIVVDDGSTDDSRAVIARYGARIKPVFKPNGGQASALNAGFALSHGELVIFLDADDVLMAETAGWAAAAFSAEPQAAKLYYRMRVIDAQGQPTGAVKPPPHQTLPAGDLRRQELNFPFDLVWMPTSGNVFSTRVLREIMPIPEERLGAWGADWYLVHLAPLFGPVLALPQIGAGYRVHGGNGYEPAAPALDLEHLRRTIHYAALTRAQLTAWAAHLRLARPAEILSVSDLANRLVSRRLEPQHHPVAADRPVSLMWAGMCAAGRRFDMAWLTRALLAIWFVAMALVPQLWAPRLAAAFLFPEKRVALNQVLRRLAWDIPA